jgi:hypothetical protein
MRMKRILMIGLAAGLLGHPAKGWAEERSKPNELGYPSLQEVYEDCLQAVKLAERDMKTFLHSACAARINATYFGFYVDVGMTITPIESSKLSGCEKEKHELLSNVMQKICPPPGAKTSNDPMELTVARDFVAKYQTENDTLPQFDRLGFYGVLKSLYNCKPRGE